MMTLRKAQPMNHFERSIRGDIARLREYYAGLMAGTTQWRNTMRRHLAIYASRARQLGVMMPSRFGNAPAALTDLFYLLAKANKAQADHGGQPIALPNHAVILRRILGVDERAMSGLGSERRDRRVSERIEQAESDREKKRASLRVQAKERGARGRRAKRQLRRMARQDRRMRRMEKRMDKRRARLEKRARGRGVGARVAKKLLKRGDRIRRRVKAARASARKSPTTIQTGRGLTEATSGAATAVTEQLARRRQQLARLEEGRAALARARAAATRATRAAATRATRLF